MKYQASWRPLLSDHLDALVVLGNQSLAVDSDCDRRWRHMLAGALRSAVPRAEALI